MPLLTIDTLKKAESKLAAEIADKKESLGQAELRAMRKKLKRAQRKRRRLVVADEKKAAAAKKAGGDSGGEAAEAASE
ncbi:hypothetical protein ABI59_08985 [Acidobacteria bacterium Mor1]|nr:hypothetical protein ABI59_08985 [Acidobacteria bacterium Mor1]